MFLHQTIQEYIDNPMGKGSTAITNRNIIKFALNSRYDELLKKHKDFEHYMFTINGSYYIHMLIPSETKRENTYDVVIKLSAPDDSFSMDNNLKRYYMNVFSNCPSFNFTFAYVYNKFGILIDELKGKYEDIVFESSPEIRNPAEIINYDKSVYFACKYIIEHASLISKVQYKDITPAELKEYLKKNIRSTTTIMREIDKENARLYEKKKEHGRQLVKKIEKDIKTTKKANSNKQAPRKKITANAKVKPKAKIKPH